MSGDLEVPGNPRGYPLCDVAQYLTRYVDPGEPGTTYIYGHAREGMFLPLFEASLRERGRSLIGLRVQVYTASPAVHEYEISRVEPHVYDFESAENVPPGQHQLILQTSEGPEGTPNKLVVLARPVASPRADAAEATPSARPRVCA